MKSMYLRRLADMFIARRNDDSELEDRILEDDLDIIYDELNESELEEIRDVARELASGKMTEQELILIYGGKQ